MPRRCFPKTLRCKVAAIFYRRGSSAFQSGAYGNAGRWFRKAAAWEPGNCHYLFAVGESMRKLDQVEQAIAAYEQAVAAGYPQPVVHRNLGHLYLKSNSANAAVDHFLKAIEIGPVEPEDCRSLRTALQMLGRSEETLNTIRLACTACSRPEALAALYCGLGQCYDQLNEVESTMRAYRKANELDPSMAMARLGLGCCQLATDQIDLAIENLIKAIQLDPECAQAVVEEVLFRRGLRKEVAEIFDAVLQNHPSTGINISRHSSIGLESRSTDLPSIFINTLPKSGTVYITSRLSTALKFPIVDLTIVMGLEELLPSWVKNFSEGGVIAHYHLDASPANIAMLRECGINRVIFHSRDPRQAIISMAHHLQRIYSERNEDPLMAHYVNTYPEEFNHETLTDQLNHLFRGQAFSGMISLANSWMKFSKDGNKGIEVMFTCFHDLLNDETKMLNRILEFYGIPLDRASFSQVDSRSKHHHRKGLTDEWREILNQEQQEYAWSHMKGELADFYGWVK